MNTKTKHRYRCQKRQNAGGSTTGFFHGAIVRPKFQQGCLGTTMVWVARVVLFRPWKPDSIPTRFVFFVIFKAKAPAFYVERIVFLMCGLEIAPPGTSWNLFLAFASEMCICHLFASQLCSTTHPVMAWKPRR